MGEELTFFFDRKKNVKGTIKKKKLNLIKEKNLQYAFFLQ